MRIDILLNKLCLTKTRSIAKKACQKQLVRLNNKIVKPSAIVSKDDKIEFTLAGFFKNIDIIEIPKGNVSKQNVLNYYRLLENRRLENG